jgi:hypothetical protein
MAEAKRAGISLNSRLRIPKLPLDILFEIPLGAIESAQTLHS